MKHFLVKNLSKGSITPKELEAINRYTLTPLTANDVFTFNAILCDNDIDRDFERFTNEALNTMQVMFIGKTVISDHHWSTHEQIGRVYDTRIEIAGAKNSLGEPLISLTGKVYILRNEYTQPLIDSINGGIRKELSIACSIGKQTCSICGEPVRYGSCENNHYAGRYYDEALCYTELSEPTDAFELSFVAVPAQRNSGVTPKDYTGCACVKCAAFINIAIPELAQRKKISFDNFAATLNNSTLDTIKSKYLADVNAYLSCKDAPTELLDLCAKTLARIKTAESDAKFAKEYQEVVKLTDELAARRKTRDDFIMRYGYDTYRRRAERGGIL